MTRIKCVCENCGKEFMRKPSAIKNRIFCSVLCQKKAIEREKLMENKLDYITNDVDFCKKIIPFCIKDTWEKLNCAHCCTYEELEQEALITIWKFGGRINNTSENKGGAYISLMKKRMQCYVSRIVYGYKSTGYLIKDDWVEFDKMTTGTATPYEILVAKGLVKRLEERPKRVSEQTYALLLKYAFENVELADIAREMKEPVDIIQARLGTARMILKKELMQERYM